MTYAEALARVHSAYPEEKRAWDRAHLWIGFAARPLSFAPSAWLLSRGATANQVTFLTAVFAYGSLPLLASARPELMLAGAFGILIYNFLDCVDGNVARASTPEKPPRGKFYDQSVGYAYVLSYLALGLGLRGETGALPAWQVVHSGVQTTAAWQALALGGTATALKLTTMLLRHDFWNVLGRDWEAVKAPIEGTAKPLPASPRLYAAYCTLTELQSHAPLLALCVAFGWGRPFLAASAAVLALEAFAAAGLYLRRAARL